MRGGGEVSESSCTAVQLYVWIAITHGPCLGASAHDENNSVSFGNC